MLLMLHCVLLVLLLELHAILQQTKVMQIQVAIPLVKQLQADQALALVVQRILQTKE